ncbi:uncharacterized protein [Spinacia oleracea]|uniref:Glycine-rich protein n=1 Tax=Spinacia oleracea TaxID=3562 RepID=A0A9R0JIM8_SPIOL|nr:uncharacterized protein LOC110775610 [Spinacia oleracea]
MATSKAYLLVILCAATLLIPNEVSARELADSQSTQHAHSVEESKNGYDGSSPYGSYGGSPGGGPIGYGPPKETKEKLAGQGKA